MGSVDAGGTGLVAEAATVGWMVGGMVEERLRRQQASRQAGEFSEELEQGSEGSGRRQKLKRRVSMWFRRSKNGQGRENEHEGDGNVAGGIGDEGNNSRTKESTNTLGNA